MTREFNNDIVFWLKMGYGILRINYRGSLGKFILNMAMPVIEFQVMNTTFLKWNASSQK